jgi:DnaJ-class molecular chaperone
VSREKPVAVCTVCGAVSYGLNLYGPCGRMVGGKRCRGVKRSRLNEADWAQCEACGGSGRVTGSKCETCDGVGWKDVRER